MSLKTRTVTALTFGVVMIGGTMIARESAAILYILVGILCLWELTGLVLVQDSRPPYNMVRRIFAIFFGVLPSILIFDALKSPYPILNSGQAHWLLLLIFVPFVLELRARSSKPFENMGFTLLGLLYIGLPTALLTTMSLQDFSGRFLIMAIMLLIWANDVFAYFSGKLMGKNKIFPHISPNKTWEGTIGGVVSALLWGVVSYYMWWVVGYELWQWVLLGAVCAVFGIIGDLIASMLKRSLKIKDTGNILPGHGGLLDRFDAFIFAVPAVAFTIAFVFQDIRFF